MRRKVRGTLQILADVKGLFMLAKPLNMTSSEFLRGLLLSHAREIREAQQQSLKTVVPDNKDAGESVKRVTCLGRPLGAKDLQKRKRRTKKELARAEKRKAG